MMNPALYQTLLNNMKLIDKDALVAEIERRKKIHFNDYHINGNNNPADYGACNALTQILDFINTLEVEEVDWEKEFYDFLDTCTGKDNGHLSEDELFRIAEYFFELGLKAQKGE